MLSGVIEQSRASSPKRKPQRPHRGGGTVHWLRPRHGDDIASLVLHHPGGWTLSLMGSFVGCCRAAATLLRYRASRPCVAKRRWCSGVHRVTGCDYGAVGGWRARGPCIVISRRLC